MLPRGNEKTVSVCMYSHAGAWERETSRPNSCNINPPGPVDPPSGAAAGCALAAPSPPQGGRDLFLLVPMLPRGNKKRSAYVCIPTQERGNKKTVSVCMHSHAGAWERENEKTVSVMYAFPRRSVGTRKTRSGQRNVCVMYAFPRRSVGTRKTRNGQRMYAFPRRSVGTRKRENGQRNVCIPTQERGNEKTRKRSA